MCCSSCSLHMVLESGETGKTPPRGRKGQWPRGIVLWPGTKASGSAGFLPALVPIRWSDLPGTDGLLRPPRQTGGRACPVGRPAAQEPPKGASTAGRRPRQGFSCAGMLSLIASFCDTFPTAMRGGIDCGIDRQGNTPLHPWLAVRSADLTPLASPAWRAGRHRPTKKAAPGK